MPIQQQLLDRHWLTPARKNLVVEEIERYGEHDRLIRMKISPQARKRNPTLPTHWEAREVGYEGRTGIRHLRRPCRLATTAQKTL